MSKFKPGDKVKLATKTLSNEHSTIWKKVSAGVLKSDEIFEVDELSGECCGEPTCVIYKLSDGGFCHTVWQKAGEAKEDGESSLDELDLLFEDAKPADFDAMREGRLLTWEQLNKLDRKKIAEQATKR